jgi:DNA-directed RNA polymerase subunit M/transcription elongation factor TFIIS
MEFAVRQPSTRARVTPSSHRCPQCREQALMLERRHVSPDRLGDALVTEFYECDCCDARYKYSPANDQWRAVTN